MPCAYEIPPLEGKEAIVFIPWKLTKSIQWKSSQQVVAPVLCSSQRQDTYCQSDDNALYTAPLVNTAAKVLFFLQEADNQHITHQLWSSRITLNPHRKCGKIFATP